MAYSTVKIGGMDISLCTTSILNKERVKKFREEESGADPFIVSLDDSNVEGVSISIEYSDNIETDTPLCNFLIPPEVWPTFVEAVKCIDRMRKTNEQNDEEQTH